MSQNPKAGASGGAPKSRSLKRPLRYQQTLVGATRENVLGSKTVFLWWRLFEVICGTDVAAISGSVSGMGFSAADSDAGSDFSDWAWAPSRVAERLRPDRSRSELVFRQFYSS